MQPLLLRIALGGGERLFQPVAGRTRPIDGTDDGGEEADAQVGLVLADEFVEGGVRGRLADLRQRPHGGVRLFQDAAGRVVVVEIFQQDGDALFGFALAEIEHGPTDLEGFVRVQAFVDEGDCLVDEIDADLLFVRVGVVVIGNLAVVERDRAVDLWRADAKLNFAIIVFVSARRKLTSKEYIGVQFVVDTSGMANP